MAFQEAEELPSEEQVLRAVLLQLQHRVPYDDHDPVLVLLLAEVQVELLEVPWADPYSEHPEAAVLEAVHNHPEDPSAAASAGAVQAAEELLVERIPEVRNQREVPEDREAAEEQSPRAGQAAEEVVPEDRAGMPVAAGRWVLP